MLSKMLLDLKGSWYVQIAEAGLSVSSVEKMRIEDIHNVMSSEFRLIVEDFFLPDDLRGRETVQ